MLLDVSSITRFDHPDCSDETDAEADLLWFATGGGKTEACLGLTAYVTAPRWLQKDTEGRWRLRIAVLMRCAPTRVAR